MKRWTLFGLVAVGLGLVGCGDDETSDGPSGSTTSSTTGSVGAGGAGEGGSAGGADAGGGGAGASGGSAGGSAPLALVHRVGRFDDTDSNGARFTWSGSSFRTRIDGTALEVELDGAANVHFEVVVDGSSVGRFATTGGLATYPLVSGLAPGNHDVEIHRRNEGFFGIVQLRGFVPGDGTTQVESARPYQHRLELVGDSLTAGYGIEGADQYCDFSAGTENAYLTYGAVAARAVNAEAHYIAYSGIGIYQDYGGDTAEQMPERFLRTFADAATPAWDFASWVPEAVVVNLGTNDGSSDVTEQNFVTAYVGFLEALRVIYPDAALFAVSWTHWGSTQEGWVDDAVTTTGDGNTYRLHFSIDPEDGYGCDWHTSVATNAKLGAELAQALETELGW